MRQDYQSDSGPLLRHSRLENICPYLPHVGRSVLTETPGNRLDAFTAAHQTLHVQALLLYLVLVWIRGTDLQPRYSSSVRLMGLLGKVPARESKGSSNDTWTRIAWDKGRAICAHRGVRVPLLSCSSKSSAVGPVGLGEGSHTVLRAEHVTTEPCSGLLYFSLTFAP
jgi:hypothetical protein